MATDDFYHTDWRGKAQRAVLTMPKEDQTIILRMFKEKEARGNTDRSLEKVARDLRLFWVRYGKGKPLSSMTPDQLKEAFADLFRSDSSYYTIADFRKHLRQFFLEAVGEDDYNPNHYKFMDGGKVMGKKKAQMEAGKDILDEAEVERLVAVAPSWKDKAYIMCAFDICGRGGDLTKLKIKDVERKGGDVWLNLGDTKEGANRVGLTFSAPHMVKWLSLHPDPKPDQFVFCSKTQAETEYHKWGYAGIYHMLTESLKRAGINKKGGLHIFRRSGATFWKLMGADDTTIESRGNWTRGSKALRESYFRVNAEQAHAQSKSLVTGQPIPKKELQIKPVVCLSCQWTNPPGTQWCQNCHRLASVQAHAKETSEMGALKEQMAMMQAELIKLQKPSAKRTVAKAKERVGD